MKNNFLCLILVLFSTNFSFGQTKTPDYTKMLIGKWEYNVAYDTIAVADDGKNESDNFFFDKMKISKAKIIISNMVEKWTGRWEVQNDNEFLIHLENNKTLKYHITSLNNNNLELQSFGVAIPTLGYKRKQKITGNQKFSAKETTPSVLRTDPDSPDSYRDREYREGLPVNFFQEG